MNSDSPTRSAPVALTIAGSDSGANAGVQADLLTFAANGVYGTSALTCVTAQNPEQVSSIEALPTKIIAAQIEQISTYFQPQAIKTGMLFNRATIETVCEAIESMDPRPKLVADPVMVASSGRRLLDEDTIDLLQSRLLPLADLVTPNLDEAEILYGQSLSTPESIEAAACELADRHQTAFLLKGGHLAGNELIDILAQPGQDPFPYRQTRIHEIDTHGSGCTLSSATAAWLAKGANLETAVTNARDYLRRGMRSPVYLKTNPFINHFP